MRDKRGSGRPRLTFKNTVSKILEEGHVKSMTRRNRYAENVAFDAPLSFATPLEIQREACNVKIHR